MNFNFPPILRRPRFILASIFFLSCLLIIFQNQYQLRNLLSYSTRPLWDHEEGPSNIIPHYYAEGLSLQSDEICALHNWPKRSYKVRIKVIDAILMSSELDLLEIRMNELHPVVDKFYIIESNTTFTGMEKKTYFRDNRERFKSFDNKIEYYFLPGGPLKAGETAFDRELHTRNTLSTSIHAHVSEFPPGFQPMVIMSDVDEIPSWTAIKLLKMCDFGETIHLKLRNYLYSFEWYIGQQSWRASVNIWKPDSYYRHSMTNSKVVGWNNVLADAGWHCSFCFRTVDEYVLKMQGYSHSDRLAGNANLLERERIQKVICEGKDIFGMLPEAYNYGDLISQMNPQPQKGAVHIPRYIIDHHKTFKFLLPGGCIRENSAEEPALGKDKRTD
ncbi:glycosyltransferase family 17 protein [Flagelloscypha sp. PMI_526]|nr:glycosyltransferase family 17 protein [Flagelloscypha sp. PMI_526]